MEHKLNFRIILRAVIAAAVFSLPSLICPISTQAQNGRWEFIGRTADNVDFYLDVVSIKKSGGEIRTWEKSVFADGSYQINLSAWRCDRKTSSIITSRVYTPAGSLIRFKAGEDWMEITPDSIAEGLYRRVCWAETIKRDENDAEAGDKINQALVIAVRAAVRQSPAATAPIVKRVRKGTRLRLVRAIPVDGWYQIYLTIDQTAWIHGNAIEFSALVSPFPARARRKKI